MAVGRVAAAALAVLALTGCGERAEPVDEAAVSYPLTIAGKTYEEPAEGVTAPDGSEMPALVEALGYEGGEGAGLLLAWASERGAETAAEAPRGYVGRDRTLEGVLRSIAELGLLLGRPEAARRLVDEIEDERERVRAAVAGRQHVSVFVDLGFFSTAGERTLVGDLVRAAGGTNVAGPTPEPGPFPLQQLADLDPDVYVIADPRTTAAQLRANPRTSGLRAVRENRVAVVPEATLRPGPRLAEGLAGLARALHPEAFGS